MAFTSLARELNHFMETQISIVYYFVPSYLVVTYVNRSGWILVLYSQPQV